MDKERSYRWFDFGDIKIQTESTTGAAQDQALSTNNFTENSERINWK
jgi:hypothetical protein